MYRICKNIIHAFLCNNIVYKNIEAEICPKIKNMLRISPASSALRFFSLFRNLEINFLPLSMNAYNVSGKYNRVIVPNVQLSLEFANSILVSQ